MCGITGVLEMDGAPVSTGVLRRMTDAVRHRGPDGEGQWIQDGIGLGHRRLAIVDLSHRAAQPMVSNDRDLVMTYNGEIYNWRELRQELASIGYRFTSDSDTEVVLHAFRHWGDACLQRFNGMFALAIWQVSTKRLFLARDRYGIKPLYYRWDGRRLLFGSEVKSLLRYPGVTVDVDRKALSEYFTFQNVFSDRTLFDGIHLLPRAHHLSVRLGHPDSFRVQRWWDYEFREDHGVSEAEYVEELDRCFERAVDRQFEADVEVGTYLSGGIDSGAITARAASRTRHLKSFTAGFDVSSASGLELAFDERAKAEALSAAYGTEHYQVVLKAGDMERVLPRLIWHLEDLRVGQSYPNFYIARLASRFVKVVLSGAGGDEIFAGYPWRYYRAVRNDDAGHYLEKYYAYWQRLVSDRQRESFFRPGLLDGCEASAPERAFRDVMRHRVFTNVAPDDYVNHSLYFELSTFLPGLLLVEDKLSMAHGLETRVPFLDNDLVAFATRVPVKYKLKHVDRIVRLDENRTGSKPEQYYHETGDGKLILRKALARYMPPEYANARKQGFSAPDGSWFRGQSIDYIRQMLLRRDARLYDFLEPDAVRTVLESHASGQVNHRLLIWSLLCFEWWLRIFRDGQLDEVLD